MHLDGTYAPRGEIEGLFEDLAEESIPNLKNLYDIAKMSKYTVVTNFGVFGIAYNPKYVTSPPRSWLDLWKPEYKGRVTMRSFRNESIELLVLMAKLGGGNERNIDPGFKKMAELSRNIRTWYTAHPECLTLLKNEEVWLALWTNGRADWARKEGANVDFVIPNEGGFAMVSTAHVIKGRPNIKLAKAFINHLLDEVPQRVMAEELLYAPSNKNAKIDPKYARLMPYGPEEVKKLIAADWNYIVTVMDKWAERWHKEVIR